MRWIVANGNGNGDSGQGLPNALKLYARTRDVEAENEKFVFGVPSKEFVSQSTTSLPDPKGATAGLKIQLQDVARETLRLKVGSVVMLMRADFNKGLRARTEWIISTIFESRADGDLHVCAVPRHSDLLSAKKLLFHPLETVVTAGDTVLPKRRQLPFRLYFATSFAATIGL